MKRGRSHEALPITEGQLTVAGRRAGTVLIDVGTEELPMLQQTASYLMYS